MVAISTMQTKASRSCYFGDNFCEIVEHWDQLFPRDSMTSDERSNALPYEEMLTTLAPSNIRKDWINPSNNLFAASRPEGDLASMPNTSPLDFDMPNNRDPPMPTVSSKRFTHLSYQNADDYCKSALQPANSTAVPISPATASAPVSAPAPVLSTPIIDPSLPKNTGVVPPDYHPADINAGTTQLFAVENDKPNLLSQVQSQRYLTQIQPGIYTYTDYNETANANIGISDPGVLPARRKMMVADADGTKEIYYRSALPENMNDPNFNNDNQLLKESRYLTVQSADPLYSSTPIFTSTLNQQQDGGAASFYDTTTGQTQYIYEQDPNDFRGYHRPQYIGRSNIDMFQYEDPMGRPDNILSMSSNLGVNAVKDTVINHFISDTNNARSDLSESMMRKSNAIAWQRKAFPIY